MAAFPKWVRKAKPKRAAVDVGRQVITERARAVWFYLELAATQPEKDVEYVHQLRVATRRATAACQVFRTLERNKHRRQLTREFRRLRQVAGAARDLDVLCERLKRSSNGVAKDDLDKAIACVAQRRRETQPALVHAYRRWKRAGRKRRVMRAAKRGLWRKPKSKKRFGDVSIEVLRSVVDQFFEAASADLSDMNALHEMRIRGKKLRYTIEIVARAFDTSLRNEVYPEFEQVQERMGVINDHVTAAATFAQWHNETQDQDHGKVFLQLMKLEEEQAETARCEFLQWWTPARSEPLRHHFQQLLAGQAAADVRDVPTCRETARQPMPPVRAAV